MSLPVQIGHKGWIMANDKCRSSNGLLSLKLAIANNAINFFTSTYPI
jgi:hypothetical protein